MKTVVHATHSRVLNWLEYKLHGWSVLDLDLYAAAVSQRAT
jgi:hypothetical protein